MAAGMPLSEIPFLGLAVKLFLIALFAPVWWPVLVEVRQEILRSSRTTRERALEKRPVRSQGFIARLHGERAETGGTTRAVPAAIPVRGARTRRGFRAAR